LRARADLDKVAGQACLGITPRPGTPPPALASKLSDEHLAGGAGQQRRAQFPLEAADHFAERRRGDVQPTGGSAEMQFGGRGYERFELTRLHKVKVSAPAGG
jgi:hypothetical protein